MNTLMRLRLPLALHHYSEQALQEDFCVRKCPPIMVRAYYKMMGSETISTDHQAASTFFGALPDIGLAVSELRSMVGDHL
jgi:hypothetical protein